MKVDRPFWFKLMPERAKLPGSLTDYLLFKFFISFLVQLFISLIASLIIYSLNAHSFSPIVEVLNQIWPLLWRSQPYMDASGNHDMFLYMAVVYLKDIMFLVLFFIINVRLIIFSAYNFSARKTKRLSFLIMPIMFFYVVLVLVFGTVNIPDTSYVRNTVFDGGVVRGLFVMSWEAPLALFLFFAWLMDQFFDRHIKLPRLNNL